MGQLRYLSAMKIADLVIGNSSSGIIEAPSFNIPTINIGDRQKGRIQAESVINCNPVTDEISKAINCGLSREFKSKIEHIDNPYGEGHVSQEILNIIKKVLHEDISLKKNFYDLNS